MRAPHWQWSSSPGLAVGSPCPWGHITPRRPPELRRVRTVSHRWPTRSHISSAHHGCCPIREAEEAESSVRIPCRSPAGDPAVVRSTRVRHSSQMGSKWHRIHILCQRGGSNRNLPRERLELWEELGSPRRTGGRGRRAGLRWVVAKGHESHRTEAPAIPSWPGHPAGILGAEMPSPVFGWNLPGGPGAPGSHCGCLDRVLHFPKALGRGAVTQPHVLSEQAAPSRPRYSGHGLAWWRCVLERASPVISAHITASRQRARPWTHPSWLLHFP